MTDTWHWMGEDQIAWLESSYTVAWCNHVDMFQSLPYVHLVLIYVLIPKSKQNMFSSSSMKDQPRPEVARYWSFSHWWATGHRHGVAERGPRQFCARSPLPSGSKMAGSLGHGRLRDVGGNLGPWCVCKGHARLVAFHEVPVATSWGNVGSQYEPPIHHGVAWFNEGPSNHQEACPAYAACARIAGRDPTRLLSWASNKQQDDKCLEYATAVSFNGYPAWYSDQHQLDAPARFWNQNVAWVRDHYPHKPFFISETGAGGLFEWDKNTTDAYWTLKYQQEVIDRDVDVALGNENVSGLTLWHFFDFKGNDGAQACGPCHYKPDTQPPLCAWYNMTGSCGRRPGGLNHKGVVDAYRRKKPSFESVKAKYGRNPPQIMIWWSDDLNKKSTFRRAWRRKEAEGASDTSGFNTDQHHCFVLTRSHRVSNQALKMPIDHLPQPCAFFSVYDGHQAAADNLFWIRSFRWKFFYYGFQNAQIYGMAFCKKLKCFAMLLLSSNSVLEQLLAGPDWSVDAPPSLPPSGSTETDSLGLSKTCRIPVCHGIPYFMATLLTGGANMG